MGSHEEYYDLGSFHRGVTTNSEDAQLWIDRGLTWSYGFNHEEAVECFEKAIKHDPNCAMAYWGLAYALGPNYNKPWEFFDDNDLERTVQRTHRASTQAKELAGSASPVEQAIIGALRHRYPEDHPVKDFSIWNKAYADAMESVYTSFPDDHEVAELYAESLMNLTPWNLWDLRTGKPKEGSRTLDAKKVLDRAFTQDNALTHPGLIHLYIHLLEMSGKPEEALPVANHLRGLVPDSGHLNHMPTHIDILCGHWQDAIVSNSDAIQADKKYLARAGPLNFYTLYRAHNYHFRIYAAMFAGQSKVALETVAEMEASIPEALLRVKTTPMADWLEAFLGVRIHVLIRFGRWQDILNLSIPEDPTLYSFTTALARYGKGVAFAATGKIQESETEQALFQRAVKRVPESRMLFNNKCIDILAIAGAMLDGELEYRRGNFDDAFSHLRKSITLDDSLPYDEPWGWMQPTRHAYGALLLEQGHVEQATAVYRADLGFDDTLPRPVRHLNNVWALQGYHECLLRLGRLGEARKVEPLLKQALDNADIPIKSSCFCRLTESKL
jgi:tetratricopeptide (TPR) repeat protein